MKYQNLSVDSSSVKYQVQICYFVLVDISKEFIEYGRDTDNSLKFTQLPYNIKSPVAYKRLDGNRQKTQSKKSDADNETYIFDFE